MPDWLKGRPRISRLALGGTWWRQDQQIQSWQLDQDPDGDGVTTRHEYLACTELERYQGFRDGDLNRYRYVGNDPHNRTYPSGLVEAMEYADLLSSIADVLILSGDIAKIGICVCQMIGAAADGFTGVQSGNPSAWIGNALGAGPFPNVGIFGAAANALFAPPAGLGGVVDACGK